MRHLIQTVDEGLTFIFKGDALASKQPRLIEEWRKGCLFLKEREKSRKKNEKKFLTKINWSHVVVALLLPLKFLFSSSYSIFTKGNFTDKKLRRVKLCVRSTELRLYGLFISIFQQKSSATCHYPNCQLRTCARNSFKLADLKVLTHKTVCYIFVLVTVA